MSRFKNWNPPKFYKKIGNLYETKYGWAVSYPQCLGLGKNVDVGYGTYIQARYGVFIGDFTQLGASVKIYSDNTINNIKGEIIIGKNCLIGTNSVIFPNVIIEDDSFIYAFSLIKSDTTIKKGEIWAGIPAKKKGVIKNDQNM